MIRLSLDFKSEGLIDYELDYEEIKLEAKRMARIMRENETEEERTRRIKRANNHRSRY